MSNDDDPTIVSKEGDLIDKRELEVEKVLF